MPWSQAFDDPIPLPRGRDLVTFEDAAHYIQKLPKAERELKHWQIAGRILIGAAEGRDFSFHARIAMMRAVDHGKPPPEKPPRRKAVKSYRVVR